MIDLKTAAVRSALGGAVLAGFAFSAAPAAAQQSEVPQGWFKVCSKQEDNDFCNVQNLKMAETGQLLTGLSLIELKGKINRKIFQISVPTGRLIPPGIGMQIDGGKPQKLDYIICFPDRCVAEAPLADSLLAALRKGGELTLTSVNFQNQPSPIKVSLEGFSGAYDGEGLKQNELEDRQKQLQAEIEKRKGDFEKKLKEEQDKAKAAN
ncbi:MAG: invasion associated locus B family protein [Rhizobiaceae bacterium]